MHPVDRSAALALLGGAALGWLLTLVFLAHRSPRGDVGAQLAGAALLGLSFALTAAPLFWLASFGRQRRIAYRGDWYKAGRRAVWVGVLVAFFVILRSQGAFSLPIALFAVVMVVFVEASLSFRR
jgi:hypothetical protein